MEFVRLIDPAGPEFGTAFALYEVSFPLHEQRTRSAQAARLSHPEYRFTLLREGERFQGILLYWEGPGFRYVEHFAIAPELRSGGTGPGGAVRPGNPGDSGDRPAGGRDLCPAAALL